MINPTEADIGRSVIYVTNYGTEEEGVLVSIKEYFVHVRYGNDLHCKATNKHQLRWKEGT